MQNVRLNESQAGITIARRNINNLRYADNTTLVAETEEELKSLLMKVKEESEKAVLKLNIQKTNIMASGPITSRQIDAETMETVTDFYWASFSLTFCMIYSIHKLNKQGDNIQPCRSPFPIWNQSVVPCPVLTVAS